MRAQRGFANVNLLLAAGGMVAAITVATSLTKTVVIHQFNARAKTQTEAALAVSTNALASSATFDDNSVAVLPSVLSASPAPSGGGQLPTSIPPAGRTDGWGTPVGYCVMASNGPQYGVAALVSAGKDKTFQTTCSDAVQGKWTGDDAVRGLNSSVLLKGRTGSITHGKPVATLADLNALQYIAPGEQRTVLDDGTGMPAIYINPTGSAGQWTVVKTQGEAKSSLMEGLVAYWPMDEVHGTVAFDTQGTHDVGLNSAITSGVFSGGRSVSGRNPIPLPEIVSANPDQVTVAFWMDGPTVGNGPMMWAWYQYDLWSQSDAIGFNTAQADIRGITRPAAGKRLLVAVFDKRTNVNDSLAPDERIYIDGVRQTISFGTASRPIASFRAWNATAYIGGWGSESTNYKLSNAFYDDVAVWSRALSDAEVQQLYRSGRSLGELMTTQAGFVQRDSAWQPPAERALVSCKAYHDRGAVADGVYLIDPDSEGPLTAFPVRCDQTVDGGGWTVIQRRYFGTVDFYRPWADYVAGFGSLAGEHWLGLDKINQLAATPKQLRIDLGRYTGERKYAKYGSFALGDAAGAYTLTVSGYSGTAGDAFSMHSGYRFTTYDNDNDAYSSNCASLFKGAWWYSYCHGSNLNGAWLNGPHASYADGVEWYDWTGYNESLTFTEMKVR